MSEDPKLGVQLDLPRPPGAIRTFFRENPVWMDALLVGIFLLATAGMALLGAFLPDDADLEQRLHYTTPDYFRFPQVLLLVLIVGTGVATLLLRRRYPLASLFAVIAVGSIIPEDVIPASTLSLVTVILLYAVPVYRSVRAGWLGYAVAVVIAIAPVPFMGNLFAGEVAVAGEPIASVVVDVIILAVISALLLVIPVIVGINAGNRRRYTEAIIDRAHQLARERDQRARLAVAEERTRIAREMHDIVAHSVSVMVTLSEGAAHVIDTAPDDATQAIQQSAETGRAALAEMRRLIGALRQDGDDPELAPTPGIEELPALITGVRAAGLTVKLRLEGTTPMADGDRSRELVIYRTVQEALTNTLRHAGAGAQATVQVTQDATGTMVHIEDDGGTPGERTATAGTGTGHGLAGLAERVRIFGGSLEYGPTAMGGWRVDVHLPEGEDGNE